MNLKHSLVFFSAGVILILFLFLMGAVPMGIVPLESSQQQQQHEEEEEEKQNDESVRDTPLLKEEPDGGGDNDKAQEITISTAEGDLIDTIQTEESKPVEYMDCVELKAFAMSFEKGWGNAVALHEEKCQ